MESDVHYTTEINWLLEAIRKVVFLIGEICDPLGVTDWRQYRHIFKIIRKQFNVVRRLKHSSSRHGAKKAQREPLIIEAHRHYVDLVDHYVQRAKASRGVLNGLDMGTMAQLLVIDGYIPHAERQIDQNGLNGFKRYIALAVLARNLQKQGSLLRERELRRLKRRRKLAA